jgi:hypothetical protein
MWPKSSPLKLVRSVAGVRGKCGRNFRSQRDQFRREKKDISTEDAEITEVEEHWSSSARSDDVLVASTLRSSLRTGLARDEARPLVQCSARFVARLVQKTGSLILLAKLRVLRGVILLFFPHSPFLSSKHATRWAPACAGVTKKRLCELCDLCVRSPLLSSS